MFKNRAWLDNSNEIWGAALLGQRVLHQYDLSSDRKGVNSSHLKQLHVTGTVAMLAASNALLKKVLLRVWSAAFLLSGSDLLRRGVR